MQDTALEDALDPCKARIEQHLGWGDAADWSTQDFEDLSLRMQEETGRVISATTLKRLWGRVTYHSRPSRHSLDTLAAFLGHDNWRAFATSLENDAPSHDHAAYPGNGTSNGNGTDPPRAEVRTRARPPSHRRAVLYVCGTVVLAAGAIVLWAGLGGSPETASSGAAMSGATPAGGSLPAGAETVLFRSRPVAQGLPNSVIFEYDVSGVQADSFFIQQSWDNRRRALVSSERQTFTSMYYYPGYFNAKLIADGVVLKEHPVHVTTEGWLPLLESEPPIYLSEALDTSNGTMTVSEDRLRERGVNLEDEARIVGFYNVRDFDAQMDDFTLESVMHQDLASGRYPCRRMQVQVIGQQSAITVPLSIPGCVSDLGVLLSDVYLAGSTNDLSALGTDTSEWQTVRIQVDDRNVRIQVGDNAPLTARFEMDAGRIVGLSYAFDGLGALDAIVLKDGDGRTVYEEAF